MYHYVYGNTGMYCIYMYIHVHEPCVQQGRPGGVAIYNVQNVCIHVYVYNVS